MTWKEKYGADREQNDVKLAWGGDAAIETTDDGTAWLYVQWNVKVWKIVVT